MKLEIVVITDVQDRASGVEIRQRVTVEDTISVAQGSMNVKQKKIEVIESSLRFAWRDILPTFA
jgi:hypothetical protein